MSDKIEVKDVTTDQVYDLYASADKIYVTRIKGIFRSLRFFGGIYLFLLYFGTVWLNWDGQQAILFDLPARQFRIFGLTFWPQDFVYLSASLAICAFGLFFITVFAGRVWCGYTCPQSVFTWVFMFIEEKTEGKRNARIKLDKQQMGFIKFARKLVKHFLWVAVSLATAVTFLGYFVPIRELVVELAAITAGPWTIFWIAFFTLATYANAGFLREQVCIYMCPYARIQSVMFDDDTLIVSYDEKRGEGRGSRKKGVDYKAQDLGDCIDCNLCVHVCPTGIDIRDGLQYECISCAACIDACDSVMEKMDYPKGLIRYTTQNALEGKPSKILRPKLIGYLVILIGICGLLALSIINRVALEVDIIRDRNQLYRMTDQNQIENSYNLRILNMDQQSRSFAVELKGLEGATLLAKKQYNTQAGETLSIPVRIVANPDLIQLPSYEIEFNVYDINDPSYNQAEESRFIGPSNF